MYINGYIVFFFFLWNRVAAIKNNIIIYTRRK